MIIVSGHLQVHPDERAAYLDGCRAVIEEARAASGCLDFHISADPVEPGRINVHEEWDSEAAVEAFRGAGPSGDQATAILDARVRQHEVSSSVDL